MCSWFMRTDLWLDCVSFKFHIDINLHEARLRGNVRQVTIMRALPSWVRSRTLSKGWRGTHIGREAKMLLAVPAARATVPVFDSWLCFLHLHLRQWIVEHICQNREKLILSFRFLISVWSRFVCYRRLGSHTTVGSLFVCLSFILKSN